MRKIILFLFALIFLLILAGIVSACRSNVDCADPNYPHCYTPNPDQAGFCVSCLEYQNCYACSENICQQAKCNFCKNYKPGTGKILQDYKDEPKSIPVPEFDYEPATAKYISVAPVTDYTECTMTEPSCSTLGGTLTVEFSSLPSTEQDYLIALAIQLEIMYGYKLDKNQISINYNNLNNKIVSFSLSNHVTLDPTGEGPQEKDCKAEGPVFSAGGNCQYDCFVSSGTVALSPPTDNDCKKCDERGNVILTEDGTLCHLKDDLENIKNGKCQNGDCFPAECYVKATTAAYDFALIQGKLIEAIQELVKLKDRIKQTAHSDEFKECKFPLDWKCPPEGAPKGTKCEAFFPEADLTAIFRPTNNPATTCEGSTSGTLKLDTGLVSGKENAEKKILTQAIQKLQEQMDNFNCPQGCDKKLGMKIKNIQEKGIFPFIWILADVDYAISCTGEAKEWEMSVSYYAVKYCRNK